MEGRPVGRRRLTLEAIFDSEELSERSIEQPRWMTDETRLSYLDRAPAGGRKTVWIYDSVTRERQPVLDPDVLVVEGRSDPLPVHAYQWSPDERLLLLTQVAPARFKPCGDLFVYEVDQRRLHRLTATDRPQRFPRFSPDGRRIGLVRDDDLWLIDVATGEERRLTCDAAERVYNGRFGWAYEEELGQASGWEWSPDGARIAFVQQDERGVPEVLLPRYEDPHAAPRVTVYPKAGDPVPSARVGIVATDSGEVRWLDLGFAADEPGEEHYVARVQWTPSGGGLLIQWMNRLQNTLRLLHVDAGNGEGAVAAVERDPAWVEAPGELRFVPAPAGASERFVWPGVRDGYTHLELRDVRGACLTTLTAGDWDVEGVCGVSEAGVHFVAARPNPTERRIYRVGLRGGEPECLTPEPGSHSALFNKRCERFVHTHSSLNHPPVVAVRDARGRVLGELLTDPAPNHARFGLGPRARPPTSDWEVLTFETSDGETLYARMLRPRRFHPSRRYPVLMTTYGGPGSQVVTNAWGGKAALWHQFLAREGYVQLLVDNRGTGARGRDFKKQTYLRLGEWEVRDQIEGARYAQGLGFVDPARIGIWGWSYGGYVAAMCILKGADVFRAAIAVAPVTDWALYDAIYTERYMRRPADNPEGYRESAPVNHTERLRGRFLLVHGTMDDNVHFQNSARLAAALQEAKRPFDAMYYPGKHHGIEDRHLHLYRLMTDFLKRSL
ncbi:MAG: DPP IV N-terminal domain-containing protein [Chthonomonadales bacterium]|nr:DPP IV N-terminal domain-containing protein [Chthonomonadales bacterium]